MEFLTLYITRMQAILKHKEILWVCDEHNP
jgi:adenosylmethionine-8-amino-7-oxononanoate aminotransferase